MKTYFERIATEESNIKRETCQELGDITNHTEDGFDLLWCMLGLIAKMDAVGNSHARYAVYVLSYRLLRILRSAYWCMESGYYDVGNALLRVAFETHLLLFYLSEKENEAKEWFEGKESEKFRPYNLRRNVSVSYDSVYRSTSEFVHPKIRSCIGWFFGEGESAEFWSTKFDRRRAFEVGVAIINILGATFLCDLMVFPSAFVAEKNDKLEIERVIKRISSWYHRKKELSQSAVDKLKLA